MQPQTAVVIGGTGFIGELLLNELVKDDRFTTVRALVRRPVGAPHPKLEAHIVDFNNQDDLKQKIGTGDSIFCCIGTTQKQVKGDRHLYRNIDFEIPLHVAQLAKDAGFKSFLLVSAVGANASSGNFYLRLKGEVENAVAAVGIENLYIFQPSMLLGERKELRFVETVAKVLMKAVTGLLAGSLRKYRGIEGTLVAKAMIAAAKQNLNGRHTYLYDDMVHLAEG